MQVKLPLPKVITTAAQSNTFRRESEYIYIYVYILILTCLRKMRKPHDLFFPHRLHTHQVCFTCEILIFDMYIGPPCYFPVLDCQHILHTRNYIPS